MKRTLVASLVAVGCLALAAPVGAQTGARLPRDGKSQPQKPPAPPRAVETRYQQKTELHFSEGDTVEGVVGAPDGSVIESGLPRRQARFHLLRVDFQHEMLKAAEDI